MKPRRLNPLGIAAALLGVASCTVALGDGRYSVEGDDEEASTGGSVDAAGGGVEAAGACAPGSKQCAAGGIQNLQLRGHLAGVGVLSFRMLARSMHGQVRARPDAVLRRVPPDVRHDGHLADDADVSLRVQRRRHLYRSLFAERPALLGRGAADLRRHRLVAGPAGVRATDTRLPGRRVHVP